MERLDAALVVAEGAQSQAILTGDEKARASAEAGLDTLARLTADVRAIEEHTSRHLERRLQVRYGKAALAQARQVTIATWVLSVATVVLALATVALIFATLSGAA